MVVQVNRFLTRQEDNLVNYNQMINNKMRISRDKIKTNIMNKMKQVIKNNMPQIIVQVKLFPMTLHYLQQKNNNIVKIHLLLININKINNNLIV